MRGSGWGGVRDSEVGHWNCGFGDFQARADYEGACGYPIVKYSLFLTSGTFCYRQSLIPVVMSGIIAVYGLVVSVLITGGRKCRLFLRVLLWIEYQHLIPFDFCSQAYRLFPICWLHPPRRGSCVRLHRSCRGLRDWFCGRLGTSCGCACCGILTECCSVCEHMCSSPRSS